MRALAQSYLNARLGEVEAERERREIAEMALSRAVDEHHSLAEMQRQRWQKALELADARVRAAEDDATKVREELHVLSRLLPPSLPPSPTLSPHPLPPSPTFEGA